MLFPCPNPKCRRPLQSAVSQANRLVACPLCGTRMRVPGDRASQPTPVAVPVPSEPVQPPAPPPPAAIPLRGPGLPVQPPNIPASADRLTPDVQAGRRLVLLFVLSLLLTLYVFGAARLSAGMRWGVAGALAVGAVPIALAVRPRPLVWLGWLVLGFTDLVRAGAAAWEHMRRSYTRAMWERDMRRQVEGERQKLEAEVRARVEGELQPLRDSRRRALAEEMARQRAARWQQLQTEAAAWDREEQARRTLEKEKWEQARREAVDRARAEAYEDARAEHLRSLEVWFKEQQAEYGRQCDEWLREQKDQCRREADLERAAVFNAIKEEAARERGRRSEELERELEASRAEFHEKLLSQAYGPVFTRWTPEWRDIAEMECPSCGLGFWGERGGDDAFVCECGIAYHPACHQQLPDTNPCRGRPGAHSTAKSMFRKISRWLGGQRPAARNTLSSGRGKVVLDPGNRKGAAPANGQPPRPRIRIL